MIVRIRGLGARGSGLGARGSGRYSPGRYFTKVQGPPLHQGDALDDYRCSGSAPAVYRRSRTERWTMSELCARYGISRPTGYLWRARYDAGALAGLEPRSSAPHDCPHQTPAGMEAQIVAARRRYGWGAKKLRQRLAASGARGGVAGAEHDQRHPRPARAVAEAAGAARRGRIPDA